MTPAIGTAGLGVLIGLALGYQGAGIGGALLFAMVLGSCGYFVGVVIDGSFRLLGQIVPPAVKSTLRAWPFLIAVAGIVIVVLLTWGVRL